MSMKSYPDSGYLMKAGDLIPALPESEREKAAELLENLDTEKLQELFREKLPENVACPFDVFAPCDEDDLGEGMEAGEVYARFDEGDLYVKQETPELKALASLLGGKVPAMNNWGIWA
jgi:hypothetical protein